MNYLNHGNDKFQKCIRDDVYVDKTGLITYTNSRVNKASCYICVSRPRRFGKSYAADMLDAYYSRGCDSHSLFDVLEISKSSDYEKYLNKYNVVHINVAESINKKTDVKTGLAEITRWLTDDLTEAYPDIEFSEKDPVPMLKKIYDVTHIGFVFIIDEWDCPFREQKEDVRGHEEYLVFLTSLLKDQEYVALAYMTGILPIKKYGTHSALNMFREISMTNAEPLEKYIGFTEAEVKKLCEEYGKSESDMAFWYNGYTVNGIRVYNPYAVSEAVQ